AAPHPDADRLGAVGVGRAVDPRLLDALLAAGRTPVVASIGSHAGRLLNLNADEVAGAIAAGAGGPGGVVARGRARGAVGGGRGLVQAVLAADLPALLARPDVRGGMIPKLESAGRALAGGVPRAWIAAWHGAETLTRLLDGSIVATVLSAGAQEATRV